MAKQSLYLKYRPFQVDNIVGQNHVVVTLKNAAINNHFSHAYLFSGNHGCGKTSTARILANLLTCENKKDSVVCGKCHACQTIHSGKSVDVKELNGATSRGIDDIKSLIESAQWSPQELNKKVFIIDECHQLTKEATSALLKILEEPPSYLVFILCTTDLHKILPTILSRCQRYNFKRITSSVISSRLSFIAKQEKINIDESGISLIARASRGSMRDAISYLDHVQTLANGRKADAKNLSSLFGMVQRVGILELVLSIKACDIPKILDTVNDMVLAGADLQSVMYELSEVFRTLMVLKAKNNDASKIDLPPSEIDELKKMGESLTLGQLYKLANVFGDIEKKMSFNINERWIMEATLIKCAATLRK